MSLDAIGLILLSAGLHATWNLLLKRAGGSQGVVAMSKIAEAILFAVPFAVLAAGSLPGWRTTAWYVSVAVVGVLLNYIWLAVGYRHGDLSIVYPISRGGTLAFLPILGAVFLNEHLAPRAIAGLVIIGTGILALQLPALSRAGLKVAARALATPASKFALLVALNNAVFTVWDRKAVQAIDPFAYMYAYTAIVALLYGGWYVARVPASQRRTEWQQHHGAIVAIAVLNTVSYLLALYALRTQTSSLVIGLRQISIAFGVFLGWRLLGENVSAPRVLATTLIVAGCVLLT